jgi:hypothetical protein
VGAESHHGKNIKLQNEIFDGYFFKFKKFQEEKKFYKKNKIYKKINPRKKINSNWNQRNSICTFFHHQVIAVIYIAI